MIISYQLITQQRHETASFYHSMYRLILVRCRSYFVDFCHAYVLFWIVMLRIYYIRSKVSNSMYCSVVKNLVPIKILSLETEMQGERTVAKNEIYAFRC